MFFKTISGEAQLRAGMQIPSPKKFDIDFDPNHFTWPKNARGPLQKKRRCLAGE